MGVAQVHSSGTVYIEGTQQINETIVLRRNITISGTKNPASIIYHDRKDDKINRSSDKQTSFQALFESLISLFISNCLYTFYKSKSFIEIIK